MSKRITKLICTLSAVTAICCQGAAIFAADEAKQPAPLSLQECINIALANQNDVLIGKNNLDIAKSQSTQAKSSYFPQISVQNNTFNWGSKGVLNQVNTGTAVTATQNIYDGGLREANTKSARYGIVGSQASLNRTVQTVRFNVTKAYYEVLRAKRLAEVADANVKYSESLRDMIKQKAEIGSSAEVDVLPVESDLANAKVSQLSAQNSVKTAEIELQNSMGLSPQAGFDVQDSAGSANVDINSLENYIKTASASRPDITEAQASIQSARASVKSSKISLYPRPVIEGQYQKGLQGVEGESSQITGSIVFDIFNGNSNRARYKEAQANQANAEQRSQQLTKDIQAQVQEAYLNLTNAKERLSASDIGLAAAQKNYDAQSERYKQGVGTTLDLLNAEVQLVTAQTNAVEARYDYYIAASQMDYATGNQGGSK